MISEIRSDLSLWSFLCHRWRISPVVNQKEKLAEFKNFIHCYSRLRAKVVSFPSARISESGREEMIAMGRTILVGLEPCPASSTSPRI
jgi:hypothetical protein